jgi:hypothetical protein
MTSFFDSARASAGGAETRRVLVRTLGVPLLLALLTAAARVGTLGTAQVWWEDEHTFGLMAQDVLRGNLPYVVAFDNKPPGLFLILAGFFALFGDGFVALRAFGDVSVFLTALSVGAMLRPRAGDAASIVASVVVVALSALPIAQSSLSEWPAAAFLSGALFCATRKPSLPSWALAAGVLMGCAVLMRTNLALVAVAGGAVYALSAVRKGAFVPSSLFAFAAGGSLPFVAVSVAYAAEGHFDLLILAGIDVASSYSGVVVRSLIEGPDYWRMAISYNLFELRGFLVERPLVVAPLLIFCLMASAFVWGRRLRELGPMKSTRTHDEVWADGMIASAGAMTLISIWFTGGTGAHYFVQIFPFLALNVGRAYRMFSDEGKGSGRFSIAAVASMLLPIVAMLPASFSALRDPAAVVGSQPEWSAARFIAGDRDPGDRIWALHHHVVLFHLREPPIARVGVHPGNMTDLRITGPLAAAGYSPAEPLWATAALAPRYVVAPSGLFEGTAILFYLEHRPEQSKRLHAWLQANYEVAFRSGPVEILRRQNGSP